MKKLCILLLVSFSFAQTPQHSNTLNWNWSQGTGDVATGFHIYKSQTTGGPYTLLATIPSVTTLTYTDLVVVAGQTNFYVVTAFNQKGDSPYSNEVTCTTPFFIPQTPASLSAVSQ